MNMIIIVIVIFIIIIMSQLGALSDIWSLICRTRISMRKRVKFLVLYECVKNLLTHHHQRTAYATLNPSLLLPWAVSFGRIFLTHNHAELWHPSASSGFPTTTTTTIRSPVGCPFADTSPTHTHMFLLGVVTPSQIYIKGAQTATHYIYMTSTTATTTTTAPASTI